MTQRVRVTHFLPIGIGIANDLDAAANATLFAYPNMFNDYCPTLCCAKDRYDMGSGFIVPNGTDVYVLTTYKIIRNSIAWWTTWFFEHIQYGFSNRDLTVGPIQSNELMRTSVGRDSTRGVQHTGCIGELFTKNKPHKLLRDQSRSY